MYVKLSICRCNLIFYWSYKTKKMFLGAANAFYMKMFLKVANFIFAKPEFLHLNLL